MKMAKSEELCRFLVGLAGEITDNVTRGLQNVGQSFTNQLTGLSAVISAQGVSQVVGSFDGEPTKYRDWNKSIETYVLLAGGMTTNQRGLLTRPAGVLLVITYKGIWLSIQKKVGTIQI